jgi:hypothetical protein
MKYSKLLLLFFGILAWNISVLAQIKKPENKPGPPSPSKAASLEILKQVKETLGKYDYNQKVKFIHPDGLTGFELQTSKKTSFESDAFWKGVNDTLSYLYEFPKPLKDSVDQQNRGTISFYPPGGENILSAFDWSKVIQKSGDTLIIPFDSHPPDNPYGKRFDWTHPGNFKNYARAWVFPNSMRPVSYKCNRKGTWTLKRNVLSFIAEPNQNEFNFELKYLKYNVVMAQLNGRPVKYIKEVPIESDTVYLELKDDQEEDDDMVSLYYDHEWIGKNIQVTNHPLRLFLPVSFGPEGSSFILHAENEGKVPPNTAWVTIHTGTKKYSITLSSSRFESAGIVLRRSKKD